MAEYESPEAEGTDEETAPGESSEVVAGLRATMSTSSDSTSSGAGDAEIDLDQVGAYFGESFPAVRRFHELLHDEGEKRGLIGPREIGRLWERHILNSAAVVPYLPSKGTIADVGSGAGLPGIVVAAMIPRAEVTLIEPMERRCVWLTEVSNELSLTNVIVRRGRAEEFHGAFEYDAVTSRAVAGLEKLCRMILPLVRPGGEMVVLKGKNVAGEIPSALRVIRRFRATDPQILEASTIKGVDNTNVVRIVRQTGGRGRE